MKMMKKFLAFAAVATMFAACSQNDELVLQDKDTPIAIATAGVNDLVASRTEPSLLTSGSLGLYVTGDDLADQYKATNLQWEYKNGWTNVGGQQLLFAGADKQSAYAYHPYAEGTYSEGAYSEGAYSEGAYSEGFTTDGATDLLWWKSESTLSAASFNIPFTHALSLLTINLKRGTNVTEDITGVTVGGTVVTAIPNFAGQTWIVANDAAAADLTATVATTASGMDATYTVLLIPQTASALKITITADGNRTFIYTHTGDQTFTAGTAYTLEITVGADDVDAGEITPESWTPVTPSDNLVTE